MKKADQRAEEQLRQGDKSALETVYLQYRSEFLNFGKRYGLPESDLADVYQDAIIALYHKLYAEQVTLKGSSLKTYLFAIGKYKILDALRQSGRTPELHVADDIIAEESPAETTTPQQATLAKHYQTLGDQCRELLRLFYYRGLTVKEIVDRGHYKDENTVKSQKSRCLKTLKERIHTTDE